jgi:hypothetical protein
MQLNDESAQVLETIVEKEFAQAIVLLDAMILLEPGEEYWVLLKARCHLGLEDHPAAAEIYNLILEQDKVYSQRSRGEAALVLGEEKTALTIFERMGNAKLGAEGLLMAAVSAYLCGRIDMCQRFLVDFFRAEGDWDEDDPIDLVLQQVLPRHEFHDFEQLYLDAQELTVEGAQNPRNRWFSINIPVYELYTASTPDKQQQRARALAAILSPFKKIDFKDATGQLKTILADFAASEQDARFGLESLKLLNEANWSELAKLILALQLEHLEEFSGLFGLSPERISKSALQQIIPLLPLRLAIGLMVLYAIADSEDRLLQRMVQEIENDLVASLIQIAFQTFYIEIDRFRAIPS